MRDSVSRALTRAGHVGSLSLGCTRIPEGKQMYRVNSAVCTNSLGTASHSYQSGNGGKPLRSTFPDASRGPVLAAGLFEESSQALLS